MVSQLKTHAKVFDGDAARRAMPCAPMCISVPATAHPITAKIYRPQLLHLRSGSATEGARLFNYMTGYAASPKQPRRWPAPPTLRPAPSRNDQRSKRYVKADGSAISKVMFAILA